MNLWIALILIGLVIYLLASPAIGALFIIVGFVLVVLTALGIV